MIQTMTDVLKVLFLYNLDPVLLPGALHGLYDRYIKGFFVMDIGIIFVFIWISSCGMHNLSLF